MAKIIRVGFDFDGVIVYNPFKIIRPIVSFLKKNKIIKRKEKQFFIPKTPKQKRFFQLLHKSSLFPVPGIDLMVWFAQQPDVNAHIVTGRFHYLLKDFMDWIHRIGLQGKLNGVHHNENNQQPHHFKEKVIKELKFDYFVEDNWDIVSYLNEQRDKGQLKKNLKVLWITNIIDAHIDYEYKFGSLNDALEFIFNDLDRKLPTSILTFSPYFTPHKEKSVQQFEKSLLKHSHNSLFRILTFRYDNALARHEYIDSSHVFRATCIGKIANFFCSPTLYYKSLFLIPRSSAIYLPNKSSESLPIIILAHLFGRPIITRLPFSKDI